MNESLARFLIAARIAEAERRRTGYHLARSRRLNRKDKQRARQARVVRSRGS